MSKVNPNVKSETERLAGGYGAVAAKQDNVSLLKRVVLANLLRSEEHTSELQSQR